MSYMRWVPMPALMTTSIASVLADGDGWNGHMDWGGGWWMLAWGTITMVGLIVLVVWLIRSTSGSGGGPSADTLDSAKRILAERYARGELTTEEYRERIDHLG